MTSSTFPEIVTSSLKLRKPEKTDVVDFFNLRNNEIVNLYLDRQKMISLKETEDFIDYLNTGNRKGDWYYWTIILLNIHSFIGTICLWNFSDDKSAAEVGYELNPKFQKLGYMTEAMSAVLDFAFKEVKLSEIRAVTHKDNHSSIQLLHKFQFIIHSDIQTENKNHLHFSIQNFKVH